VLTVSLPGVKQPRPAREAGVKRQDHAGFTRPPWRVHAGFQQSGRMKLVAIAVLLAAAAPAFAESSTIELAPTCVEIDASLDQLLELERANARILLVRALERAEQLVVETGCTETVTLSHVRDAQTVIVRIKNSRTKRKLTVGLKEDMSEVYDRMVASLLEPVVEESPAEVEAPPLSTEELRRPVPHTMPNVDESPEDTKDLSDSSHWYVMLGFAGQVGGGQALIGGYRRNMGGMALDLGLAWLSTDRDDGNGATSVAVRGRLLRVSSPRSSTSFYWGAGFGLAAVNTDRMSFDTGDDGGGGAQFEVALGWELRRASALRWYIEGGYSKPLFDIGADSAPSAVTAALGVGF